MVPRTRSWLNKYFKQLFVNVDVPEINSRSIRVGCFLSYSGTQTFGGHRVLVFYGTLETTRIGLIIKAFSVVRRSTALDFFKQSAEVERIVVPELVSDASDGLVGFVEQFAGPAHF